MKILIPILLFITCHAAGQGFITCAVGGCNCSYPITYNFNDAITSPGLIIGEAQAYDFVKDSLDIADVMQIDTIPAYMHTRGTWIPGDSSISELLHIRFRKVMVQDVMMGQKAVYTPETDREQGNSVNQKSRIITYQIAMDDEITEEQKEKIKQAIDLIMFNSPGTPVIIDTVDAEVSEFSAGWVRAKNPGLGWYMNSLSYSNVKDATAIYKDPLPYKRIEIWSEKKDTHGKMEISIGNQVDTVDLYNPTHLIPFMIKDFNVPLGIHEVKVRVLGEKHQASKNSYGLLDFYRIFR